MQSSTQEKSVIPARRKNTGEEVVAEYHETLAISQNIL